MLIGEDFEKIQFQLFGLDLVEPNAFIGDTIVCVVSLICAYKVYKLNIDHPFFINWKRFFIVFALCFFVGGVGHTFYNYFGVPGKFASWYSSMISVYFIEIAMISIFPVKEWQKSIKLLLNIKLVVFLSIATYIYTTVDLTNDPGKGLNIVTIYTSLGLLFSLGFLGAYYQKKIDSSFKYLWISMLILIPSAFFQTMKINFHQYFDRNDASHILVLIGLILYLKTVREFAKNKQKLKLNS